ncbi:kanamycin nucleotidyltransferase C-terminal domain-containing protein [Bacillus sp. Au-Bac7]|uniref:kanamycin nucleotidyltransferase C-terminal domain-containing protein n=1 Tax=Bacillus sp. Au-Bac7 TaxID=2906458 RepID=UPI001E33678E|nr:kanamycin nucleotidyltransferase C-terminal domain-containing protein [Bacillus sp. Au-Bac7]MCE4049119.1 hypothetical protein [Bacillus sp. Au-Bac7]
MISKATNIELEWSVKSDVLYTCKVLYDLTNFYEELRETVKEAEELIDLNSLFKDAITDMYEHVYKLFLLSETVTIIAQEARLVAYWAVMSVGLKNKHTFLSSRTMYKECFELDSLSEAFEQRIRGLLSLKTDVQNLKKNVGELWVATLNWAGISKKDLSFL